MKKDVKTRRIRMVSILYPDGKLVGVKWLIDQLKGARGRNPGLVCYLRENGPIAYELALFDANPRERMDAMFETGLAWYWTTANAGARSDSPDWIELTRWSMPALLNDLAGATPGGRTVIAGVEPLETRPDLARDLVVWGRRFATDDRSPLHVLVHHAPGQPEHVFVAQQPTDTVLTLLHAWGVDRARAHRRAYPRLRDQSLEAIVEGLRSDAC